MISLSKSAQLLREGNVVACATETVWGLAACAFDDEACRRIYELKGRPGNNPLIIHVSRIEAAEEFVTFNEAAYKLSALMPGPLTLVLPKREGSKIAPVASAGLDTLAVRIPASNSFCALIDDLKMPIAAPSANKSNYISSTKLEHVQLQFAQEIDAGKMFVMQPGHDEICYGLESTIIDCTQSDQLMILRSGFVLPQAAHKITNLPVKVKNGGSKIIAPGMMQKHYAPRAQMRLNATNFRGDELVVAFGDCQHPHVVYLSAKGDLFEAAANLYDALHEADRIIQNSDDIKSIAVMQVPNMQIGIAINDRLTRAAAK